MLFNSMVVLIIFCCLEPLAVEGCGVKTSVFTCIIIGNMGLQGGLEEPQTALGESCGCSVRPGICSAVILP